MRITRGAVVSVGERVRQGSMYPLYTELRLTSGQYVNAITKFPAMETRAPAEAAINEWMGTIVAALCGLQVPACFLVEASPDTLQYMCHRHGLNVTSRFGFASLVSRIHPIVYPATLTQLSLAELARLYCFDMLFVNADRTPENPNCGHGHNRIFAYDFGSSFFAPGTSPSQFDRPYFGSGLTDRASAHLCRAFMNSTDLVQLTLSEMLDKLTDSRWTRGLDIAFLPPQLREHIGLLIRFLEFLADERDMVTRQIVSTIWF